MSEFRRSIPLDEIQPGDHFDAVIETNEKSRYGKRPLIRRCTLVEICGPILRVKTGTRKQPVEITRDKICHGHAWGMR